MKTSGTIGGMNSKVFTLENPKHYQDYADIRRLSHFAPTHTHWGENDLVNLKGPDEKVLQMYVVRAETKPLNEFHIGMLLMAGWVNPIQGVEYLQQFFDQYQWDTGSKVTGSLWLPSEVMQNMSPAEQAKLSNPKKKYQQQTGDALDASNAVETALFTDPAFDEYIMPILYRTLVDSQVVEEKDYINYLKKIGLVTAQQAQAMQEIYNKFAGVKNPRAKTALFHRSRHINGSDFGQLPPINN